MTGDDGYSLDLWRDYFSNTTNGPTDEEVRALDELGAGPYDDHSAGQMLDAYRLGRAHERAARPSPH